MYTQLAAFYDWPGVLDFSEKIQEKIIALFEQYNIQKPGPLLDLACGTGTLTISLAQAGWEITGLDDSESMLSQAQQKHGASDVQWRIDDMRSFKLSTPVKAVLCTYDSINHLLNNDDLLKTFQAVYNNLEKNGLFIFDVNTHETFCQLWEGKDSSEGENVRLTFNTTYNPRTGRAVASITAEYHGDDGFEILEDTVTEQYYDSNVLEALLQQAGFPPEKMSHEPFTPLSILPEGIPLKTLWVCQK